MSRALEVAKAFVGAAVAAGAAAYGSAANDGVITQQEWGLVAGAALVAGILVFLTPNRAAPAARPKA